MTFEEQSDFVRNLKGAASSVLWILLLSGRSLTARRLEEATGYSDKPITRALRWLEARGYVQNNGRLHGWSLGRTLQPHLPFALPGLTPSTNGSNPDHSARQTPHSELVYNPYHPNSVRLTDRNNSDLATLPPCNSATLPNRRNSDLPATVRNISDPQSENLRTPSPDLICSGSDLTADINKQQPDQTRTERDLEPRKNPEHQSSGNQLPSSCRPIPQSAIRNPQSPLAHFLQRIQMRSPAYERILARDNLPEVVSWYWESLGQDWMDNPNGWIVRRLDQEEQPLQAYTEFAQAWLSMTETQLQEYYAAGCHPYGLEDYWRELGLIPDAITAFDVIKKAGGLDLFDDFPRPILSIQP